MTNDSMVEARNTTVQLTACLVYLAFVVYGSLVPLDFQPRPLPEALNAFSAIGYLDLGIGSRADWVANILLFIPLSFLVLGLLWPRQGTGMRLLVSLLVWIFCLMLSIGIEFTQLFFPPRTVSQNDILAEVIGGTIGIFVWWWKGSGFVTWFNRWHSTHGRNNLALRLLSVYLFLLFGYNLLPLDLTISPVEIYHKWNEGRIILFPFRSSADLSRIAYETITDVLLWIPVSLLWVISGRKTPVTAMLWTVLAVICMELAQLFIWTRVTDVTDILTGSIGAFAGVVIASRLGTTGDTQPAGGGYKRAVLLGIAIIIWCLILLLIFWYPFDILIDRVEISRQISRFFKVPFYTYYYSTEYRAITSLFNKLFFFAPLGVLLALLRMHLARGRGFDFIALSGASLYALGIELGQTAMPAKTVDSTDWLVASIGIVLGYQAVKYLYTQVSTDDTGHKKKETTRMIPDRATTPAKFAYKELLFYSGLLAALIAIAYPVMQSGAVPYNVRELLGDTHPLLGISGLSIAVIWGFGVPAWISQRLLNGTRKQIMLLPVLVIVHAGVMYLLLRISVPVESLHDIVGTPVLDWPVKLETPLRFIAFYSAISTLITGGAAVCVAMRSIFPGRFFRGLPTALVLLPLAHWVVVSQAATDNLTELMASGGSVISSMSLGSMFFLFGFSGSLISMAIVRLHKAIIPVLVLAIITIPLAYMLLFLGTESQVQKYGSTFSAMQFLLSPDRNRYLTGNELIISYMIFNVMMMVMVAMAQYPFWLLARKKQAI